MADDLKDLARGRAALVVMASVVVYILWMVRAADAHMVRSRTLRGTVIAEQGPKFRVGQLSPHATISPDGRFIATLSVGRSVIVWKLGTGRRVFSVSTTRRQGGGATESVGFSPDSRFLVTAAPDKTITLWEVNTGREALVVDGPQYATVSAKFAPNGSALATLSKDGSVTVWHLAPVGRRFEITARTLGNSSVAFTPDGNVLAVAEEGGTLQLYDVKTGRRGPRVQPMRNETIVSAIFLYLGETRIVALRNSRGTVRVYNLKLTARGTTLQPAKYFQTTPAAAALFGDGGEDGEGGKGTDDKPAPIAAAARSAMVPLMSEGRFVVIDFEPPADN